MISIMDGMVVSDWTSIVSLMGKHVPLDLIHP